MLPRDTPDCCSNAKVRTARWLVAAAVLAGALLIGAVSALH